MKCQILFAWKDKKSILTVSSTDLEQSGEGYNTFLRQLKKAENRRQPNSHLNLVSYSFIQRD